MLSDGKGTFALLMNGEAILLDTSDGHLYRAAQTAQQWFMGDLILEVTGFGGD